LKTFFKCFLAVVLLGKVVSGELTLPDLAERQSWDDVAAALESATDPNLAQAEGTTALHWAAYHDRADLVTDLLKAGAKAEVANRYGITPLLLAAQNGNGIIVELLLKSGANVHAKQRGGESALMIASRTGRPESVLALLDAGADVTDQDRSGQTALMWAADAGNPKVVAVLLEHGAERDLRLDSGFTAFLFAAREGKSEVVHTFLKAGADPREAILTDDKTGGRDAPAGTSAVLLAVENGHFELALDLVKAGADSNDLRSGTSALHTLTWVRKPAHGDDEAGQPPPETSGRLDALSFIRELVAAGADPNLALTMREDSRAGLTLGGVTPFFLAAKTADLPMMKALVALGADPLRTNADGSTPLMAAAGLGCYAPGEEAGTEDECVAACKYLLDLGADINAVDRNTHTAMHGAAYKSLPKVVALLAERGADLEIWNRQNNKGWTPLLIAQGFRPGNFKPSVPTITAFSELMRAAGVEPPPPPDRESLPKKKGYEVP